MRRLALLCASLVACADGPIADSTPTACAERAPPLENDGSIELPDADVADASPPTRQDLDGGLSDADAEKPLPIVNPTGFRCRVREVGAAEDFGIWRTGVGGTLPHTTITVHRIEKDGLGQFEATWNKASDVLTIRASPANAAYEVIGIWSIGLNDERTVTTNQPGTGNFSVGCWVE